MVQAPHWFSSPCFCLQVRQTGTHAQAKLLRQGPQGRHMTPNRWASWRVWNPAHCAPGAPLNQFFNMFSLFFCRKKRVQSDSCLLDETPPPACLRVTPQVLYRDWYSGQGCLSRKTPSPRGGSKIVFRLRIIFRLSTNFLPCKNCLYCQRGKNFFGPPSAPSPPKKKKKKLDRFEL